MTNLEKSMSPASSVKQLFKKWADFETRISRSEFWWSFLFLELTLIFWEWIFRIVLRSSQDISNSQIISILSIIVLIILSAIALFFIIAQTSLFARRLHDVNKSGWWQLLPITIIGIIPLIYWLIKKSIDTDNKWGRAPSLIDH